MKRGILQVSVTTTAEAEEVVLALLEQVFAQPATTYTDERTKRTTVSVYCPNLAAGSAQKRRIVQAELKRLKKTGLNIGSGRIFVKRLPRENWAESWKRHFKPIEIGGTLLVKPSWSKRRPRKGQAVVVLDPGLSFGTGQHPTTGFCLRHLGRCRRRGQAQSFLDMGTGSGILAIAAAKLGYTPVEAFDFDPESVRVARENARQNGVFKQLRIHQADLTKLPLRSRVKYDFICANLISTLLIAECGRIVGRLRRGGVLVLAGILESEFAEVRKVYERFGLQFTGGRCEKGWRSGAFVFRG